MKLDAESARVAPSGTTETVDDVRGAGASGPPARPFLFVVLEAARPVAGGMRIALEGVDEVRIVRGPRRELASLPELPRARVLSLPSPFLSGDHARLRRIGSAWLLEDRGSRNGTFVEGARVTEAVLRDGASIEVGRVFLSFRERLPVPRGFGGDAESVPSDAPSPEDAFVSLIPEINAHNALLAHVARGDVPIVLSGPSGAGKEWLARAVHAASGRPGALVATNCGALPGTLLESTLFGHVRGAFSGAMRDEPGLVRSAHGGTLLLDEIGDMPPAAQVAWLRVLQERQVTPVGSVHAVGVDVRFLAATWQNLEKLVEDGRFRHDLLARITGYVHRVPALKDRREDIGVILAGHLRHGARAPADVTFDADAARHLVTYDWPRNAREVARALDAALAMCDGVVRVEHLPTTLHGGRAHDESAPETSSPAPASAPSPAGDELRERLLAELASSRGNVAAVARAFGKAPFQVHRWMKRWSIDPDAFRTH